VIFTTCGSAYAVLTARMMQHQPGTDFGAKVAFVSIVLQPAKARIAVTVP
jgi:hypothetical protein